MANKTVSIKQKSFLQTPSYSRYIFGLSAKAFLGTKASILKVELKATQGSVDCAKRKKEFERFKLQYVTDLRIKLAYVKAPRKQEKVVYNIEDLPLLKNELFSGTLGSIAKGLEECRTTTEMLAEKTDILLKAKKTIYVKHPGEKGNALIAVVIGRTLIYFCGEIPAYGDHSWSTAGIEKILGAFYESFVGTNIQKFDGKITLGADPEFLFYNKNAKYPKYNRGTVEASHVVGSGGGAVGTDGDETLAELRPDPTTQPMVITRQLGSLLSSVKKTMLTRYGRPLFMEAGGGCHETIGGHIHFGHDFLARLDNDEVELLVSILDDFIYYPMKINMAGAVRKWHNLNTIERKLTGYCDKPHDNIEAVHKAVLRAKIDEDTSFSDYEGNWDEKYRRYDYGIEYRSLPCFVGDERLTYLIFKLSKNIVSFYLKTMGTGGGFEYKSPPAKEDYLRFLSEEEIAELYNYFFGSKRGLFLDDTLRNWGLKSDKFFLTASFPFGTSAGTRKIKAEIIANYGSLCLENGIDSLGIKCVTTAKLKKNGIGFYMLPNSFLITESNVCSDLAKKYHDNVLRSVGKSWNDCDLLLVVPDLLRNLPTHKSISLIGELTDIGTRFFLQNEAKLKEAHFSKSELNPFTAFNWALRNAMKAIKEKTKKKPLTPEERELQEHIRQYGRNEDTVDGEEPNVSYTQAQWATPTSEGGE